MLESYCTKLGGKIDKALGFIFFMSYILMILIGLPALLIKVFIVGN